MSYWVHGKDDIKSALKYTLLLELAVELTTDKLPIHVAGAGMKVVDDWMKELPESEAAGKYTPTQLANVRSAIIPSNLL